MHVLRQDKRLRRRPGLRESARSSKCFPKAREQVVHRRQRVLLSVRAAMENQAAAHASDEPTVAKNTIFGATYIARRFKQWTQTVVILAGK